MKEDLQQLHLQEQQLQVQLKQQQVDQDKLIIDLVEAILTIFCLFWSLYRSPLQSSLVLYPPLWSSGVWWTSDQGSDWTLICKQTGFLKGKSISWCHHCDADLSDEAAAERHEKSFTSC